MRKVGVEEELILVDASGIPTAVAGSLLHEAGRAPGAQPAGEIEAELQQQQIEVETTPTDDLEDLADQVLRWRTRADELARGVGARAVALATSPLPVQPTTTIKPRYQRMVGRFGLTTMEQLTCGCHVHVDVADDDEGAAVVDWLQPWLPVLLALSANSPFWQGRDSGYASFRTQVWARFPTAGPTAPFGSGAAYRRRVDALVDTGVLLDQDMIYFSARLSRHYPTVEIRVADVCASAADSVLVAGLARALVETAAREWADGVPLPAYDVEEQRLAVWRASRSGVADELVDPRTGRPGPATEVVTTLLEHVAEALTEAGDADRVGAAVDRILTRGTGADRQRRTWAARHDLAAVVAEAADVTTS